MKVGILTYHGAHNYGAYLQACALCNRLNREEGISAEIIDYRSGKEVRRYDARHFSLKKKLYQLLHGTYFFNQRLSASFERAMKHPAMILSRDSLVGDSIEAFTSFVDGKYDVIVVGSDEVWKVNNYRGFPTPYWLFGDLHCRKLSYAASARVQFRDALDAASCDRIREALSDFEYIGVRDEFTMREVAGVLGDPGNIHLCCDPSFILDFDVPESDVLKRIEHKKGFRPGLKTVLVMLDNEEAAQYVKTGLGDKYNLISVFEPHKGFINCPDVDPFDWLFLIQNVDFVIASFFHAICFSIINNRPFLAVGTKGKKSKLTELLDTPSLKKRYVEIGDRPDLSGMVDQTIASGDTFDDYVLRQRQTFDSFLSQLKAPARIGG